MCPRGGCCCSYRRTTPPGPGQSPRPSPSHTGVEVPPSLRPLPALLAMPLRVVPLPSRALIRRLVIGPLPLAVTGDVLGRRHDSRHDELPPPLATALVLCQDLLLAH